MASSSKKWARFTSRIASVVYFLVIIMQIPLFRFPCGFGICTAPIEVTVSQLIARQVFPTVIVKTLLYPGAITKALVKKEAIPSYDSLLYYYKLKDVKEDIATNGLQHLEVLAGSYLSVAGAILGFLRSSKRMSLFGTLLILWGLGKELVIGKNVGLESGSGEGGVHIFTIPMSIAVVSAFLCIRRDVRKIIRSFKINHISWPLWTYSKLKHK